MTQVWGLLMILVLCPLLGGLPLIDWITRGVTGRQLKQQGTRNLSVSAAFYHGGKLAGILAVLSEAFKGIAAVLLARYFFPGEPVWEIVSLIALVMGRYWMARGAGTTNVVWGYVAHDWIGASLIALIGGISFTILRERRLGRFGILVLLPLVTALRHPADGARIGATVTLSILLGWIYQKIPDDLDLSARDAQRGSQAMFKFFRGDRALLSLDQSLQPQKVGAKAATLSTLKRKGYPVPMGWVVPPGDDATPLMELLNPQPDQPLIVRSSAIGEDSGTASAAGQYLSIANVTTMEDLGAAILQVQASYNSAAAAQYRRDFEQRDVQENVTQSVRSNLSSGMSVLVQHQVVGAFSGVAFSRDPIHRQGDAVVIEALPGSASKVVSGRVTPEQYRVLVRTEDLREPMDETPAWKLPDDLTLPVEGEGDVPRHLIQQVAYLTRQLEAMYHGIPQDIEWSYDGNQLWLLQSRPITTLLPIWTRRIAAEVIPGFIRPLTWSINRPLTCGVWGEIFTVVLGDRARGLNFEETATLHHSAAYFNASLLGEIFRRMGLPPESLEFLTRGAKFSKPPLLSTLRNGPGLLRLAGRERRLEQDFEQDYQTHFAPGFVTLAQQPVMNLQPTQLLDRIDQILVLLRKATYYSILSPLSLAVRKGIAKMPDSALDNGRAPEVASLRSLQSLAISARLNLPQLSEQEWESDRLFASLTQSPTGQSVLQEFDRFLQQYGYLSDVATDIAVPCWQEDPQPVRDLFAQLILNPLPENADQTRRSSAKTSALQRRLDLKGRVTEVYSKLLAELRWSFVALEKHWLQSGWLKETGDIFFLQFDEIQALITGGDDRQVKRLDRLIASRRDRFAQDQQVTAIPNLVYGNDPPGRDMGVSAPPTASGRPLRGIGASPGQAEGRVLVLQNLRNVPPIDRLTILVVPYTDSGWAPLLARAGGIIAEVGGQLSHGAIVAREYGIPAVMDVHQATQLFTNGQWVRIDGQQGIVERMD